MDQLHVLGSNLFGKIYESSNYKNQLCSEKAVNYFNDMQEYIPKNVGELADFMTVQGYQEGLFSHGKLSRFAIV